jgi:hypothetical protein
MHKSAIAVQFVGRSGVLTVITHVMTAASIGASQGVGMPVTWRARPWSPSAGITT